MFPSYNHNINFGGHTFHVQTEVSGHDAHSIITHLFLSGDIIATTRTPLDKNLSGPALQKHMQKQHQDAMRALIGGAHNNVLAARGVTLAAPPAKPS